MVKPFVSKVYVTFMERVSGITLEQMTLYFPAFLDNMVSCFFFFLSY